MRVLTANLLLCVPCVCLASLASLSPRRPGNTAALSHGSRERQSNCAPASAQLSVPSEISCQHMHIAHCARLCISFRSTHFSCKVETCRCCIAPCAGVPEDQNPDPAPGGLEGWALASCGGIPAKGGLHRGGLRGVISLMKPVVIQ